MLSVTAGLRHKKESKSSLTETQGLIVNRGHRTLRARQLSHYEAGQSRAYGPRLVALAIGGGETLTAGRMWIFEDGDGGSGTSHPSAGESMVGQLDWKTSIKPRVPRNAGHAVAKESGGGQRSRVSGSGNPRAGLSHSAASLVMPELEPMIHADRESFRHSEKSFPP